MNETTEYPAPKAANRAWVFLKRILVVIVILIAAICFLANAAGLVGVWIARRPACDTVTALSTLVNSKLGILDRLLARINARVDEGRQALARVNGAANKLGDRLGESSPLVTALANAVGDDLGPKIAEALAQARALHDAAVSVNATLETLNSLGFVNVPTFTDELSAVSERVGGAQSDVQQLRAVSPTFGRIPGSAMWIFDTVGLTVFMACVGLAAGPSFFSGLQTSGISLVFVGLVIAILPHTVSILFGRYVLKMNPVIVLGACSGAGTITAALRAIQEEAESDLPALGYTVPYAIGNIVLTAWGPVLVAMMT